MVHGQNLKGKLTCGENIADLGGLKLSYRALCALLKEKGQTPTDKETMIGTLQCVAVCCSVLQCVAVCCSLLQCVTFCCAFCDLRKENGQTLTDKETMIGVFVVLQCVAVCCSVLQCVAVFAVCCSVLQCRAFCALRKEKGQTPTDEETMTGV